MYNLYTFCEMDSLGPIIEIIDGSFNEEKDLSAAG